MNVRLNRFLRLPCTAVLLTCLIGCGSRDNWMPMKVGKQWNYQVRAGFDRRIEPITVRRQITVASADGYELAGPLGLSRVAWKHGSLVAESTVNARFFPPIPLLVPGVELTKEIPKQVAVWHGRVVVLGKENPASATLTERNDKVDLGTRKVNAILATLTLKMPRGKIQLDSWYQEGVGLIQQEQRTGGIRIVQLQLLDKSND